MGEKTINLRKTEQLSHCGGHMYDVNTKHIFHSISRCKWRSSRRNMESGRGQLHESPVN